MSSKDHLRPPSPPSREERLAKALRENLARRKALARSKQGRESADAGAPAADDGQTADHGDAGD